MKAAAPSSSTGIPPDGCLRLKQVLSFVPVGKSTWWAGVKSGKYPQPIKLDAGITAWRAQDIRSFLERAHAASADAAVVTAGGQDLREAIAAAAQKLLSGRQLIQAEQKEEGLRRLTEAAQCLDGCMAALRAARTSSARQAT